jgi:hypothetical protein
LVLAAAPAAFAGVGAGDVEAGVSVSVSHTSNTSSGTTTTSDSGNVGGNVGYFFTDMIEGKLAVTGTVTTATTSGTVNPGADFVFLARGRVAPFVGASYALSWGDTVGPVDSDFIEGHAGVKFFIRARAALEAKLARYEPTDSAAKSAHTVLSVGINVYF